MNDIYIIIIGVIIFCFLIALIGYIEERKTWNNGFCKETGMPWQLEHIEYAYDNKLIREKIYRSGDYICIISFLSLIKANRACQEKILTIPK